MADAMDVFMGRLARVVGGTVNPRDHTFFSGAIAKDGTGITGIKGCYSVVPKTISPRSTPVAIIYPAPFTATLASEGEEDNVDRFPILLLVAPIDKSQISILVKYRDLVPAAFRAHMRAFPPDPNNPDALSCFIESGTPGEHEFAGIRYYAWEFICRCDRMLPVVYVA
jgi:hypothetical protein